MFYGQELGRYCLVMRALTLLEVELIWTAPNPITSRQQSDKVLVLLMVSVSIPSYCSSFDINLIPLEQIERVEILGSTSIIYGNTAAAVN